MEKTWRGCGETWGGYGGDLGRLYVRLGDVVEISQDFLGETWGHCEGTWGDFGETLDHTFEVLGKTQRRIHGKHISNENLCIIIVCTSKQYYTIF